jgi:hypothetical protein
MSADAKEEGKVFRAAVLPLSGAIAGPGMLFVLCLIIRLYGWRHLDLKVVLAGMVAVEFAGVACAWAFSVCFPNKLNAAGVHGHSFWGVRRFIRWGDIQKATPFRYLVFRFLRLHPVDGKAPTWIALSQARQKEFEEEVRKLAPADCPIRAFLN